MDKPVWAIIVEDDCDPITPTAHLMVAFEGRDEEIDERIPACGQVFREGWMHSYQDFTNEPKCKKCLKKEAENE